jgi:hypothetical protein
VFGEWGGTDTVNDFTDGEDVLDFSDFGFADADAVIALAAQVGADTVITLSTGEVVKLLGVDIATLDTGDFLI